MKQVSYDNKIPANSIISKDFEEIDYCDTFQVQVITNDSIDAVTTKVFKMPEWADFLMRIRNLFVKIFGLKTGNKNSIRKSDYYPIGSKAVYFTVIDRNENEIIMGEKDKHLNFRTSVMIKRHEQFSTINLTTVVKFNNVFGKMYFIPVKPFHKLIIKSLMKRLLKKQKI